MRTRRLAHVDGVFFALGAAALTSSCADKTSSQYVADQFADAYFRRMDQEAALKYTALGATEMLDEEIQATHAIRESGYTPLEAATSVNFTRGPATAREARVDYHYVITIRSDDSDAATREADVELAKIAGGWKVVTVRFSR